MVGWCTPHGSRESCHCRHDVRWLCQTGGPLAGFFLNRWGYGRHTINHQIWHDQHGIPEWVQGKICLKAMALRFSFTMRQMRPGLLLRWGWTDSNLFTASGQLFNHGRVSVEPWVWTWQGTGFKQAPRRLDLGTLGLGSASVSAKESHRPHWDDRDWK